MRGKGSHIVPSLVAVELQPFSVTLVPITREYTAPHVPSVGQCTAVLLQDIPVLPGQRALKYRAELFFKTEH